MITDEQAKALAQARELVKAGCPIFYARAAHAGDKPEARKLGFALPRGWQSTTPSEAAVDAWQASPAGALCMVTGVVLDGVDIDTRHGASEQAVRARFGDIAPRLRAETPSGGVHLLVPALGVGSRDNVSTGLDVKSGQPDGAGRGFLFIAPTVRVSKVTGQPVAYRWSHDALVTAEQLRAPGPASASLVAAIRALRADTAPLTVTGVQKPRSMAAAQWDTALTRLRDAVAPMVASGKWDRAMLLRLYREIVGLSPADAGEAVRCAYVAAGAVMNGDDDALLASTIARVRPDDVRPDDQVTTLDHAFFGQQGAVVPGKDGSGTVVPSDDDPAFAFGTAEDFADQAPPPQAQYGAFGGSVSLFYADGVHWLQGESESGKSWVGLAVVLDHLRADNQAIIVDYEDNRRNVRERLRQLGMTAGQWSRCVYVDGHATDYAAVRAHLASTTRTYAFLLLDGVTSALSAAGLSGRDEQELTQWVDALPRQARSSCCVDHVVKANDERRGMAIGSQAKKSVVTGSSWEVVCIEKFGRGSAGAIKLILQKDKPGGVRGQGVKELTLSFASDAETGTVTLSAGLAGSDGLFAALYERGVGGNVSQRALRDRAKELGHGYGDRSKGAIHKAYVEYVARRMNEEYIESQNLSVMAVPSLEPPSDQGKSAAAPTGNQSDMGNVVRLFGTEQTSAGLLPETSG